MPRESAASPNPIDVHVGMRLRERRVLIGLSQEKLAEALGLTFQQVQKYENGYNRLAASRLYVCSQTLGVPPGYFFVGLDEASPPMPDENLMRRETLELVRRYYRLDEPLRTAIFDVVKEAARGVPEAG